MPDNGERHRDQNFDSGLLRNLIMFSKSIVFVIASPSQLSPSADENRDTSVDGETLTPNTLKPSTGKP